ncbi:MAG: cytochrome b [Methylibium sp.]|uniref:cytochrome b n=1 Tax=Methylibium sp. TaxID=2067992 RepID=UPI00178FF835|nr:cytochrome b [Methylibium sp.]MBA3597533.1 cytochrome b [Methylibium sp.]
MALQTSPSHYSRLSIAMHWLMLVLIALTYLFIELRELFARGSPERNFMRTAHFSLGLMVLALVCVRLAARVYGGRPSIVPAPPRWKQVASQVVQVLLYALMIGMPLAGWVMLSLRGNAIPFFGLELPPLTSENKELGKLIREWHGDIGRAGYALIGLHAAAALTHHFVWRDNTLRRMLPGRAG